MARAPEFDRNEALIKAMRTFWQRGYEPTSMADLLNATGLSRSSLYSTFGSKHELFVEAYDLYRRKRAENLEATLAQHPAPEGIRAFFQEIIDGAHHFPYNLGCMTTNQAAELAPSDAEVFARVDADNMLLENVFTKHIRAGQASGSVPSHIDAAEAARAFVAAFSGFQLTVRAGLERTEQLEDALDYLMRPLEG